MAIEYHGERRLFAILEWVRAQRHTCDRCEIESAAQNAIRDMLDISDVAWMHPTMKEGVAEKLLTWAGVMLDLALLGGEGHATGLSGTNTAAVSED